MYFKAGFLAALALVVSSTTDARYNPDLMDNFTPLNVGQSAINKSVELNLDVGGTAWALFGAGTFVGLMATYGQDLANDCLSDSVRITVASVHTYEYMTEYIDSGKTDNIVLAQAMIYIIDAFEALSVIDCSNFDDDLSGWIENADYAKIFAIETDAAAPTVEFSPSKFPFVA